MEQPQQYSPNQEQRYTFYDSFDSNNDLKMSDEEKLFLIRRLRFHVHLLKKNEFKNQNTLECLIEQNSGLKTQMRQLMSEIQGLETVKTNGSSKELIVEVVLKLKGLLKQLEIPGKSSENDVFKLISALESKIQEASKSLQEGKSQIEMFQHKMVELKTTQKELKQQALVVETLHQQIEKGHVIQDSIKNQLKTKEAIIEQDKITLQNSFSRIKRLQQDQNYQSQQIISFKKQDEKSKAALMTFERNQIEQKHIIKDLQHQVSTKELLIEKHERDIIEKTETETNIDDARLKLLATINQLTYENKMVHLNIKTIREDNRESIKKIQESNNKSQEILKEQINEQENKINMLEKEVLDVEKIKEDIFQYEEENLKEKEQCYKMKMEIENLTTEKLELNAILSKREEQQRHLILEKKEVYDKYQLTLSELEHLRLENENQEQNLRTSELTSIKEIDQLTQDFQNIRKKSTIHIKKVDLLNIEILRKSTQIEELNNQIKEQEIREESNQERIEKLKEEIIAQNVQNTQMQQLAESQLNEMDIYQEKAQQKEIQLMEIQKILQKEKQKYEESQVTIQQQQNYMSELNENHEKQMQELQQSSFDTNELLQLSGSRLEELQKEFNELQNKAQELSEENEILELKIKQQTENTEMYSANQDDLNSLTAAYKLLLSQKDELVQKQQVILEVKQKQKDDYEKLNLQYEKVTQEKNTLGKEKIELVEQLKSYQETGKQDADDLKEKIDSLASENQLLSETQKEVREENYQIVAKFDELKSSYSQLQKEKEELSEKLSSDNHEEELVKRDNQIVKLKEIGKQLQTGIKSVMQEKSKLEEQLALQTEENQKLNLIKASFEEQSQVQKSQGTSDKRVEMELKTVKQKLTRTKQQLEAAKSKAKKKTDALRGSQKEISVLKNDNRKLLSQLSTEKMKSHKIQRQLTSQMNEDKETDQ